MVDVAKLTANVDVKGAREAADSLSALDKAGQTAAASLGRVEAAGAGIGGLFARITTGAVSTAAGFALFKAADAVFSTVGDSIIGLNSQLEQAAIGFETMTGSAEGAQKILSDLKALTVQTPFEFPDLVAAAQRMGRFGIETQQVIPIITALGDAMAAGGTIGKEALDRATLAIAQMSAKTRVMTQEMNQLTESGIPAWQILAKEFGVSTAELQKMVQDGVVPADKAIAALVHGIESGNLGGAMKKQSDTFQGAMSNISDAVKLATSTAFKPAFEAISELARSISAFVTGSQFQAWSQVAQRAVGAVVDALKSLVHGDFDTFGAKLGEMAQTAGAALLHLVNAVIPVVIKGISALADLGAAAVSWGANLAVSYAQGLIEGASTAITAALNAIGDLIMSFFAGHSPPPKGPLHTIDTAGTLLINTYLEGMTHADFSILNTVTSAIKDVLQKQVDLGSRAQEGLIPALLGGENAVADAIGQLKEFGSVSDETFNSLRSIVGDDADAVIDLFKNLEQVASLDRDIQGVNDQMKDLDRQTRALQGSAREVRDRYKDQEDQLTRTLSAAERLYDTQIRASKTLISSLERQIALREKELNLSVPVSDAEAALKVEVAKDNLAKSQNAVAARRAAIMEEIARIQGDINDESAKGAKADPKRLGQLQNDLARANLRLQTEGVQTAEDALRIAEDQRGVLQAEADLRKQTDPDLKKLTDAAAAEKDHLATLEAEKSQAVDPIKAQLEDIKQARDDELLVINQQLSAIQDQRGALQDQLGDLTDQKTAIEANVAATTDRLHAEADVAAQLRQQADLLDRMAEQAAGGAAGAKGKGGPDIAAALGGIGPIKPVDLSNMKPIEVTLPDFDLKSEKEKLKAQIHDAVSGAVSGAFDDFAANPALIGISVGALAGGIIGLFTPLGPVLGAALGGALGAAAVEGFKILKDKLVGHDVAIDDSEWAAALGVEGGSLHIKGEWEGAWNSLVGALSSFKDGAVRALQFLEKDARPILTDFIAFVTREFDVLQKWWDENGDNVVQAASNVAKAIVLAVDVGLKLLRPVLKFLEDYWDMTFKGILGVVSVVAAALAGDFDGIKKIFGDVFGGMVQILAPPIAELTKLAEQIIPKIPGAFQTVSDFVTNTLVPAFNSVSDFITNTLVPAFQTGSDFVTNTLIPVLTDIKNTIQDDILPPMNNIRDFINDQLVPAFQAISDFITNTLIPAFGDVKDFIANELLPKFNDAQEKSQGFTEKLQGISDFINNTLLPAMHGVTDFITNTWNAVIGGASDKLADVRDKLGEVGGKLSEIWQKAQDTGNMVKTFLTDRFNDLKDKAGELLDKFGGPAGIIAKLAELVLNATPIAGILTGIATGIDSIVGAIGRVAGPLAGLVSKLGELKNLKPDLGFITGQSPSPLAIGISTVGDAADYTVPKLSKLGQMLDGISDANPDIDEQAQKITSLEPGWQHAAMAAKAYNDELDRERIAAYDAAKAEGERQRAIEEANKAQAAALEMDKQKAAAVLAGAYGNLAPTAGGGPGGAGGTFNPEAQNQSGGPSSPSKIGYAGGPVPLPAGNFPYYQGLPFQTSLGAETAAQRILYATSGEGEGGGPGNTWTKIADDTEDIKSILQRILDALTSRGIDISADDIARALALPLSREQSNQMRRSVPIAIG